MEEEEDHKTSSATKVCRERLWVFKASHCPLGLSVVYVGHRRSYRGQGFEVLIATLLCQT